MANLGELLSPIRWRCRPLLQDVFNAPVEAACIDPAEARNLFNLATYRRNDAENIRETVNAFVLDIPRLSSRNTKKVTFALRRINNGISDKF